MAEYTERGTPPTPTTRKGEGLMDDKTLKATIAPILTDCVNFVDTVLSPERETATKYYNGEPFGNEEEGRSQIVLTEVRDAVSGVLPDLLRIFFGPERVVEYLPRSVGAVNNAKIATDYAHFSFVERNNGFLETMSVLKDGLVRKIGIFKSWWDESADIRSYTVHEVTQDDLFTLAADEDVKLLSVKEGADQLSTVHYTRCTKGRLRIKSLPPEEFLYNRTARDMETAVVLAHRTRLSRGELMALGISKDDLDEYGSATSRLANPEEIARQADVSGMQNELETGEANELVDYTEAYIHLDYDGDGFAELRQICTIGVGYHPVKNEPVDEHPFSIFIPDPEPHTLHGSSLADRTMDLQRAKSNILRAQFDSLAASIFSRMAYIEGQANVNDILNTEIGAPIRMRSIGAVQPLNIPFSGEVATPILAYLDEVSERRIGRSKGVEGLDADALQSTTADGVHAAVAGAQAQTEMLARLFAEMTLKPLFRRVYRLLKEHQPKEMVKLRDRLVEVNPHAWEPDLDVGVNVGLGSTLIEKKLQTLVGIVQKQEFVLTTLGMDNPIVSLGMYADSLQRGVELGGFRDVESFFKSVAPDWKPPQMPPQPNADMMLVQIEQQKAQSAIQQKQQELELTMQTKSAELAFKDRELQQKYELEQQQMQQAFALKLEEMRAQFGAQVDAAKIDADVAMVKEQAKIEAADRQAAADRDAETQRHAHEKALEHERELTRMQLEHERGLETARIGASAQVESAKHTAKAAPAIAATPTATESPKARSKHRVVRGPDGRAEAIEEVAGTRKHRVVRDATGRIEAIEAVSN